MMKLLAEKYRYRLYKSEEYNLHPESEREYCLEFHIKRSKDSFISLYDSTTLYVYIADRRKLIMDLRNLGFKETRGDRESVFHIPISHIELLDNLAHIVKIRSFSDADRIRLRDRSKNILQTPIDSALNRLKIDERVQKGVITPEVK